MERPPLLGDAAPDFARVVERALRNQGLEVLARQVAGLPIGEFCSCAQRCSAFLVVPLAARPAGALKTHFVLNTEEAGFVLVDTVGKVIVGVDILDDGQLRTAVEHYMDRL